MKKLFFCLAAIAAAGATAHAQETSRFLIKNDGSVKHGRHNGIMNTALPIKIYGGGGVINLPDGTTIVCPIGGDLCAIIESSVQGPIAAGDRVLITPVEDSSDPFNATVLEIRYENGTLWGRNLLLLPEGGEGIKQRK